MLDLLTDLLHQAGLRRRLLHLRRLPPATALRFPCERSIGLHVLTQGRLHVHADGLAEPLTLEAGDIAVMARGCNHTVSSEPSLQGLEVTPLSVFGEAADSADAAEAGAEDAAAGGALISGAYQLWNTPVHPFFGEIPGWLVLRADSLPRLGPLALSIGLLEQEVRQRDLGADTVVHGLMDVIFTYVLREIVQRQGGAGAGWSQAVRDPQVRKAVALMHSESAHPWTLDELATRTGLSRTSLAERFREAMGETPLAYLRTVRMQKAMRLLSETGRNLEQVALEVGYQDAFSFSKVFKRTVGVAPKEFRKRDAEDMASPWRVKA
jgi:AraC-like DNA-binding protein